LSIYLVTGGAGFIGSHIVEELVRRREAVRVLDNLATGHLDNLTAVRDRIEWIEGDIRCLETARKAVEGVDYVLHQAALPSVPRSINDPLTTNQVNVEGTLNLLVAARDAKVKRLVFASSSSIYGDTPVLPKHEDMPPNPKSPYAISKLAAENYCCAFHRIYGLETVSLRYFNVFGPRQDPKSQYAGVIPLFMRAMLAGRPFDIFGDGEQSRDFTFVRNVVNANLLAATAPEAAGKVFNIACGQRYTLNHLVHLLTGLIGRSAASPVYRPARTGDVKHSQASIERARQYLHYQPQVPFEEGLAITLEWLKTGFQ